MTVLFFSLAPFFIYFYIFICFTNISLFLLLVNPVRVAPSSPAVFFFFSFLFLLLKGKRI